MPNDANASFSTSLTLCAQLPDGWLSWGAFCDSQYQATRDSGWLESAVTAYLQVTRPAWLYTAGIGALLLHCHSVSLMSKHSEKIVAAVRNGKTRMEYDSASFGDLVYQLDEM